MTDKILDTVEAWEDGNLGRSEEHAQVYTPSKEEESAIDDAFGLKAISIRLEKELIEDFKKIGEYHGVGYQPMMRQALHRFAQCEIKRIALELMEQKKQQEEERKARKAA